MRARRQDKGLSWRDLRLNGICTVQGMPWVGFDFAFFSTGVASPTLPRPSLALRGMFGPETSFTACEDMVYTAIQFNGVSSRSDRAERCVRACVAEVDIPPPLTLGIGPQRHGVAAQCLAHANGMAAEAQPAAFIDLADPVAAFVLDGRQATGKRALAAAVTLCGRLHPQRLMRSTMFVQMAPGIELPLGMLTSPAVEKF